MHVIGICEIKTSYTILMIVINLTVNNKRKEHHRIYVTLCHTKNFLFFDKNNVDTTCNTHKIFESVSVEIQKSMTLFCISIKYSCSTYNFCLEANEMQKFNDIISIVSNLL